MTKLEAIEILLEVDPTTVIDENWWSYMYDDPKDYNAMMFLSGLRSYSQIVDKYEGLYIRDFISKFL